MRAAVLTLRRPAVLWQLARFAVVGASGTALNLGTFQLAHGAAHTSYRVAAVVAFLVAVTNNFAWNRRWTFAAQDGAAGFQAWRFVAVSLASLLVGLAILDLLVHAGVTPLIGQAAAIVLATPLNFLGNKLWSFRGW